MQDSTTDRPRPVGRRSFLRSGLAAAGTAALSAAAISSRQPAHADRRDHGDGLTKGDAALLQFAAAAEIIETDMWQQYNDLGGVSDASPNSYQQAISFLDGDGQQYVTSNTLDEISHVNFLDAYLKSKGAQPVNLDAFRTLPSSKATGAQQIGRLTNLMQLTVDTSWYIRYRSTSNPDFGASFEQALSIVDRTAIPRHNSDFADANHIQVIANTAAFHFAAIEQGGSSLYATFSGKATSLEVERILVSIGGAETHHFGEWMDFAGNAVQGPPYSFDGAATPVSDNGLTFPNFNEPPYGTPLFQTNLIFPVACEFISPDLPFCSVIRPTLDVNGGAMAAVNAFTNSGIFIGQSKAFHNFLVELAEQADAAMRED